MGIPRDMTAARMTMGSVTVLLGASGTIDVVGNTSIGLDAITVVPEMASGLVGGRSAITGTIPPVPLITSGREHYGEKVPEHSSGMYWPNTAHCSAPLPAAHPGRI